MPAGARVVLANQWRPALPFAEGPRPLLALWGEHGRMEALFDVLATWQEKAKQAAGHALPCGHFIPEEAPGQLLAALRPFLRGA